MVRSENIQIFLQGLLFTACITRGHVCHNCNEPLLIGALELFADSLVQLLNFFNPLLLLRVQIIDFLLQFDSFASFGTCSFDLRFLKDYLGDSIPVDFVLSVVHGNFKSFVAVAHCA